MNYLDIRDSLKTGDLVLFSGEGFISRQIQRWTRSRWSHVGMVYESLEGLQLWESTTLSSLKDIELGKLTRGVQTCWMSDRLASYRGAVAIRPLGEPLDYEQVFKLKEFRKLVRGRPYEENHFELAASAFDFVDFSRSEDLSSLFCSELVAEAYQRCGLFAGTVPSNEFTPADFGKRVIPDAFVGSFKKEIFEVEI